MKTNKELKPFAKSAYIAGKDVMEIAAIHRIKPGTIYNWIRRENWKSERDGKKSKSSKAPEILLEQVELIIEKISKEMDPGELVKYADTLSKIVKSMKSLYRDQDRLSQVLFVIGELGNFLRNTKRSYNDEFYSNLDNFLERFQEQMLLKYSPNNLT